MSESRPDQWVSNATIDEVASFLPRRGPVAVLTHAKPDGDAIGSTLALVRALRAVGADAAGVFPAPWFGRFDPFLADTPVVRLPPGEAAANTLRNHAVTRDPAAVAIVDTGSWAQVADARSWLEPLTARAVVVDHHPSGNAEIADRRCIITAAAAACEIIAPLVQRLLGLASAAKLPPAIAEPLYLGLATDTGWFRYSNTHPGTLRLAADLMDAGADHSRVLAISEQSDRPARLRIVGKALESLELIAGGRVAVMSVSLADLAAAGADLDDAGGLTDLPQAVASVRAVAVLTEAEPGVTKVSLRSKPPIPGVPGAERLIDVNLVARRFGGGGHVHASGAKIKADLADARRQVGEALTEALDEARP